MEKVCSKCDETKPVEAFISRDRCICKACKNASNRENYNTKKLAINSEVTKPCNTCQVEKPLTEFIHPLNRCKECNNNRRREEYYNDAETNERIKAEGRDYKRRKTEARQKARAEAKAKLEAEIGEDNTICKYCKEVVPKTHFRHNRLKCKDCERDDPNCKLIRDVRSRIWSGLDSKKLHTVEYLGCTFPDYKRWLMQYSPEFTMENRGTVWHIDHVIPLYHFNMDDPAQQLIAFNWRNTAPLLARDNLAKNNRILPSQIEQHLSKLNEYHITHNIEFPIEFSNLFATRPNCGKPP
jgi:hypothetical protein